MDIRTADESELDQLAIIWHDGWQDTHAPIMPPGLARYRTLEFFRDRLQAALPNVLTTGPTGQLLGFCITKDDELYQFYIAAGARGKGVAAALLAAVEERLVAVGIGTAWLTCAIGNDRAARFYEKHSWCRVGNMTSQLPTPDGPFPFEVWRYEKDLSAASRPGKPSATRRAR